MNYGRDLKIVEIMPEQLQIGERIGAGQYGSVFKGTLSSRETPPASLSLLDHSGSNNMTSSRYYESPHEHSRRTVAVKMTSNVIDIDSQTHVLLEATMMASLRHANIVQMLGVVVQVPVKIVIEYLALGNLLEFIRYG
jgi:serine/threonine protein kinase